MTIALLLALGLLFLFSGVESGVQAVHRVRLRRRALSGDKAAAHLESLLQNRGRLLATVLLAKTIPRILALVILFQLLSSAMSPGIAGFLLLLLAPLLAFLCEFLPKLLFRSFPYRTLVALGRILHWTAIALFPVVYPLEKIGAPLLRTSPYFTRKSITSLGHLRALTNQASDAEAIVPLEKHILHSVLNSRLVLAGDLALPLSFIVPLPAEASLKNLYELAREKDFDRIPVIGDDGALLGVIRVFDLLADQQTSGRAQSYTRRMLDIPHSTPLLLTLQKMRAARTTLAAITDHNGICGIVFAETLIRRALLGITPPRQQ